MPLTANRRTRPNRRAWWIVGGWVAGLIVAGGGLYARYQIAAERLAEKAAAEVKLHASQRSLALERAERAEAERLLAKAEADFLREQEFALGDLRNSAMHGYGRTDSLGRITLWNLALTRWLGWTEEEMLGRNITDIMEPDAAAEHIPAFKAYMADKSKWKLVARIACRVKHKDPNRPLVAIYVTARALPTKEDPNVPYAFALIDLQSRVVEPEPAIIREIKRAAAALAAEQANEESK